MLCFIRHKCGHTLYNFGIHECSSGKGYMYVWPESIASRGPQEIASCHLKHFIMADSQASHLIVFSNACGGQNRKSNIACFWMYIVGVWITSL